MTAYDGSDGRVTNAILSTKLDSLNEEVQKLCDRVDRRMSFLEEKSEIRIGEVDGLAHANARDIAVLGERVRTTTGILGTITFIGSAIAAAVGSVVK